MKKLLCIALLICPAPLAGMASSPKGGIRSIPTQNQQSIAKQKKEREQEAIINKLSASIDRCNLLTSFINAKIQAHQEVTSKRVTQLEESLTQVSDNLDNYMNMVDKEHYCNVTFCNTNMALTNGKMILATLKKN